ncbi:MAG TPA: DNA polymerase III subunit delta [Chryseosolibacter sp.]
MKFENIPGLTGIKRMLIEAVKTNHSAHAQLFVGAEGALNLPLALAYATYLHCENKGDDSCGVCPACSKNAKYIHPDTHFVFPLSNVKGEKDDERLKADITKSWRSFLLEQPFGNLDDWCNFHGGEDKLSIISKEASREIVKTLSLKPFESKNKVMIIWQPESMHPGAANGILKILEEPSPNTYFILVTNAADQLMPTIISRTQIITVPLLADDELETFLKEKQGVPDSAAGKIVQLADGNINLALKLISKEEDNSTAFFTEWMRACFSNKYASLVAMAEEYHALDKLSQRNMISYGINMMRETLLYSSGAETINRTRGEEREFVQNFSRVLDVNKIETSFKLLNDAGYHLERNGSAKMIFLDLSLKISQAFKKI